MIEKRGLCKWPVLILLAAFSLVACTPEPPPVTPVTPAQSGQALKPWPGADGRAMATPAGLKFGNADAGGIGLAGSETTLGMATPWPAPGVDIAPTGAPSGPASDYSPAGEPSHTLRDSTPALAGSQAPNSRAKQGDSAWDMALAAVPGDLILVGEIFQTADVSSATDLVLPLESGQVTTTDLYGWDGRTWSFVPSDAVQGGLRVSDPQPQRFAGLALMKVTGDQRLTLGARFDGREAATFGQSAAVAEVTSGGLIIHSDGTISGEAAPAFSGRMVELAQASFSNDREAAGAAQRPARPVDAAAQELVADALVERLAASRLEGLNLAMPAIDDSSVPFISALADGLHARDLVLALSLALEDGKGFPDALAALGRMADLVYLEMPAEPRQYGPGGWVESRLAQVLRRVERRKVMLLVEPVAYEDNGSGAFSLNDEDAWNILVGESAISLDATAESRNVFTAMLTGPIASLSWDDTAGAFVYTHDHDGQPCNVWLGGELAVDHWLVLANSFQLRGLAIMESTEQTGSLERALAAFQDTASHTAAVPQPVIRWQVTDASGRQVAQSESGGLSFVWQTGQEAGDYRIEAILRLGPVSEKLGEATITVLPGGGPAAQMATPQGSPPTETPAPGSTPVPLPVQAAARETTPMRAGPGLAFAQIDQLQAEQVVTLTGRTVSGNWFRAPGTGEGDVWILAIQLEPLNDGDVWALPVVEVPPPPMAAATRGDFSIGGQTHYLTRPNLMAQSGMSWVKFQHKWAPGDGPEVVAGRILEAHANGLYVLLSITGKELYPGAIDFEALVNFLGGVAALGPDAIEIWNEANLDREWPAGQIDPAVYVGQMLAPAYQAIKASNPAVMVISGALAPTGVDDGVHVWADDRYLAGMAAAGAADYMDCIGAHHNAGATSPYSLSGHPGGSHYSWYFWPTLRLYHDAFDGRRPVCFTELGYLSGEGFSDLPAGFAWAAGTSLGEHAQWLGQAVKLAAQTGQVRLVIVFNVDFSHWGDDPQAGYAILRADGSCPACATLSAAMSPG